MKNWRACALLLLLLWPVAAQAQSRGLEVVAMAEFGGRALLVLLVAGPTLLLLLGHDEPPELGYQLCIMVVGPVAIAALSVVCWVVLWLKGAVHANSNDGLYTLYILVSLVFAAYLWLLKKKARMARALVIGSGLGLLLIAAYDYSTTTHIPPVPPMPTPPLGLVQADVRDASVPASATAAAHGPPASLLAGYDLQPGDERPGFPGGETGLRNFVRARLHYPLLAHVFGIEGTVYVSFIVLADGRIGNIETTDSMGAGSVGAGCDGEARRVVELLPGFAPARRNGEPIAAKAVLAFAFSAQ